MSKFIPLVVLRGDDLLVGLTLGQECDVPLEGDDEPLAFRGGLLSLDLPDEQVDVGGAGGGSVSMSVDLAVVDLMALRASGCRLQALECLIYAWAGEACLADAVELYRGVVRAPSFDVENRTVELRAAEPVRIVDVSFPPGLVNDPGRFPVLNDSTKGATIPVIVGHMQSVPLLTIAPTMGNVLMLIAGHPIYGKPGNPGRVDVWRVAETEDGAAGDVLVAVDASILTVRDGLGDTYSAVLVPAASWSESGMFTGELFGALGAFEQPIEGLGDALDFMVRTYGRESWVDLDRGRTESARAALNRFRVGLLFNDRAQGDSILSLLTSRIAGQFPVAFGAIAGRWGWDAVLYPDDPEAPPALELTYEVNAFDRSTVPETDAGEVRNRFVVEWGMSGATGRAAQTYERDAATDDRCNASQSRWGRSAEQRFAAPDAADVATAALLCDEQAKRLCEPRETVSYLVTDAQILRVPRWSVVAVTDPKAGWTRRRFMLASRRPATDGTVSIGLISLSPPGLGPGVAEASMRPPQTYGGSISSGGSFSSGGG